MCVACGRCVQKRIRAYVHVHVCVCKTSSVGGRMCVRLYVFECARVFVCAHVRLRVYSSKVADHIFHSKESTT